MKRLCYYMLLAMILVFSTFSQCFAGSFELPKYITVGLKYGSSAVSSGTISSSEGIQLGTFNGDDFDKVFDFEDLKSVIVKVDPTNSSNVLVTDETGTALYEFDPSDEDYCFISSDDSGNNTISFANIPYRGSIEVKKSSDGKLTIINRLLLQEYLYGVIPKEMPASSNEEALKAQAVAARNFVAVNLNIHSASGFNICGTTHCQVYGGFSAENSRTNEAVDDTEGIVMMYDGKPITACYHKNSGGHTENSENIWTAALDYLRGVTDEYSPSYPWEATLTFDQIETKLKAAGYDPGNISSVTIKSRTEFDSVKELQITGSNDTVVIKKDNIRKILGFDLIKSLKFSIVNSDSVNQVCAYNGSSTSALDTLAKYVMSESGKIELLNTSSVYASNGDNTVMLSSGTASEGDSIHLIGKGSGHLLGMSQDGAMAMGKAGFSYEDILKYYYTDIELVNAE